MHELRGPGESLKRVIIISVTVPEVHIFCFGVGFSIATQSAASYSKPPAAGQRQNDEAEFSNQTENLQATEGECKPAHCHIKLLHVKLYIYLKCVQTFSLLLPDFTQMYVRTHELF